MADFTPHQQKIIKRYYNNQEQIQRQRLAELVSELYLSTGKKRQRVWESVASAMQKLGVPQSRIDHLRGKDDPALVAQVVKELEGK
jgi:acetylornithine deacetylase/succinyl-diaminopimelate desuccinylase-like protein